jgi:hypothetical protein
LIIGKLSIDPRRVIASMVTQEHGRYTLTIKQIVGAALMEIDDYFSSEAEARQWQEQLDGACYKGILADAISDKALTDDNDDDECGKIGF